MGAVVQNDKKRMFRGSGVRGESRPGAGDETRAGTHSGTQPGAPAADPRARRPRSAARAGARRAARAAHLGRARRPGAGRTGAVRTGLVVLALASLAAGCASGAENSSSAAGQPREGASAHASGSASPSAPAGAPAGGPEAAGQLRAGPARALDAYADRLRASALLAKKWGLERAPLAPPEPPAAKPRITTRRGFEVDGHERLGLPPVFTTVPTDQKVVFLTIDDGAEKDPEFLRMMTELEVPYTAFLSDYLVKEDYGYFKDMQSRGVGLNNHTLSHPYLPGLSYERQKQEICGMQDVIHKRYGKRPELFRPPFGNYNKDTLRIAKSCGVKYVPLWNEEVFVDRWEYREWDRKLHPGDIVLSHFRGKGEWKGSMTDMVRRFLDKVTAEGYAVARLEDYL